MALLLPTADMNRCSETDYQYKYRYLSTSDQLTQSSAPTMSRHRNVRNRAYSYEDEGAARAGIEAFFSSIYHRPLIVRSLYVDPCRSDYDDYDYDEGAAAASSTYPHASTTGYSQVFTIKLVFIMYTYQNTCPPTTSFDVSIHHDHEETPTSSCIAETPPVATRPSFRSCSSGSK